MYGSGNSKRVYIYIQVEERLCMEVETVREFIYIQVEEKLCKEVETVREFYIYRWKKSYVWKWKQ